MHRTVFAVLFLAACDAPTAPRVTAANVVPAPPITCVLRYVNGVPVDVCTVRHDTL